ncbi:TauD/TfdA family dioxygenase [Alphaproteobacteria bacterium]|nr:TauD/TfdA family dioxygenase [Alphaproteobacteria bacterium]
MSKIEINRLSDAIGAEIRGVDLREELDAETAALLKDAWHEHQILLFRDQDISNDQQRNFAEKFGPLGTRSRPGPKPPEAAEYGPNVMLVSNIRKGGEPIGSLPDGEMMFHSDTPYFERPAKATILYAIEITSWGGHTLFSNSYTAAEALPEDIKRRLAGRKGMQVYEYGTCIKDKAKYDRENFPHFAHPIFRKHPATGKSALYVSELMTEEIEGLPVRESDELLEYLFQHQRNPKFIYEHPWVPGDILMWDNRCSVHARTDFPREERRMLRRLTVEDEFPVLGGEPPYRDALMAEGVSLIP